MRTCARIHPLHMEREISLTILYGICPRTEYERPLLLSLPQRSKVQWSGSCARPSTCAFCHRVRRVASAVCNLF